jgi:hypothetical protein
MTPGGKRFSCYTEYDQGFYSATGLLGEYMKYLENGKSTYIRYSFLMDIQDFKVIQRFALEKGFDGKDHSPALRMIIRAWRRWKEQQTYPLSISVSRDKKGKNE